jgi:hypothetical protein
LNTDFTESVRPSVPDTLGSMNWSIRRDAASAMRTAKLLAFADEVIE